MLYVVSGLFGVGRALLRVVGQDLEILAQSLLVHQHCELNVAECEHLQMPALGEQPLHYILVGEVRIHGDEAGLLVDGHYQQIFADHLDYGAGIIFVVVVEKLLAALDELQVAQECIQHLDFGNIGASVRHIQLRCGLCRLKFAHKQEALARFHAVHRNRPKQAAIHFLDAILTFDAPADHFLGRDGLPAIRLLIEVETQILVLDSVSRLEGNEDSI